MHAVKYVVLHGNLGEMGPHRCENGGQSEYQIKGLETGLSFDMVVREWSLERV